MGDENNLCWNPKANQNVVRNIPMIYIVNKLSISQSNRVKNDESHGNQLIFSLQSTSIETVHGQITAAVLIGSDKLTFQHSH